ncbi:hypothetical protein GUITHDRAFT_98775 [Guillardia theta CCMP2712]|uniref:Cytochrome b5 heme-binding domain-containing protein n=1 Tax=Guillardia theta (strain CCMP2712) TaxID=905079 RepID=L1I6R5_GUITC|nr:hypothetical protein GUITHDRAFT_98775 [Guillardia theta CCMP2712]EKX31560.1 hypothetical protein GUITHDRAFT_98775 [Guillardia theta CCMP2712]|mmetsp:Transcript_29974/g.96099  ORF Transcript_29974/g.96099 Transcript_29974/m.96099 type:complete len:125 (+) Transcript_29974:91-465(+)|eukprot:XP_005818540.1 hypothetical protein GUITHDRAFT_98775 [Guillardia theta CCMP2712]
MVQEYSSADLELHKTKEDCWMAIHGKVYDVTKFLIEHPGGEEVMLEVAGMDATDAFEDIGHSKAAREQLKKYEIGDYKSDGDAPKKKSKLGASADSDGGSGGITKILVPVLVMAVIAFLVQKFM